MNPEPSPGRRLARPLAAVLVAGVLFAVARLPELPREERLALASRFRFTQLPLAGASSGPGRSVRDVHPALAHIRAWISAVGAAVALNDLDGDGLPNDVCRVETRTDEVIVAPAPGEPARYPAFTLHPAPLAWNPATMAPMGCLPADVNEDGRVDLVVYYWGRTPVAFLRREPVGGAAGLGPADYVVQALVPGDERWYTNAAATADVDGDGHADLVVGNYFPDGARILDRAAGGPEQMQDSMSRAANGGRNRILLWADATAGTAPSVRYADHSAALVGPASAGWTLGVGAADLDGDLRPELYVANDFGPDRLLHNRSTPGRVVLVPLEGERHWSTPGSKVLGHDSFKGMGVDFGDLDGDGVLDMFVSNIAAEYALEESHFAWIGTGRVERMRAGIAPYDDRSEALGLARSGWGWDTRLVDLDNDGVLEALQATGFVRGRTGRWPELHELALSNDTLLHRPGAWFQLVPGDDLSGHDRNPLFVRAADGRYYDLAADVGLGEPHVSRGIATADVDGDGRLDFAVANQWEPSYLYRNASPDPGAFLGLHLLHPVRGAVVRGVETRPGPPGGELRGRPAIGATASVWVDGRARLAGQVDGGNGHSGKRSFALHLGLGRVGDATRLPVEVRYRDTGGEVRIASLRLTPGWHTVVLPNAD